MVASEILSTGKITGTGALVQRTEKQQWRLLAGLGRLLPTTATQIKAFITKYGFDVLGAPDIRAIEAILNAAEWSASINSRKAECGRDWLI